MSAEIGGQRQVLEEARVRLQHAAAPWNARQRRSMYSCTRRAKIGRSKRAARARRARGSKRASARSNATMASASGVHRLLAEEDRGRRLVARVEPDHRLEHPAAAQRDRRPAGGRGLQRHDAEVLDGREEHRPAARVELGDLRVAPPAEERDVGAGQRSQAPRLGPLPDDQRAGAPDGWPRGWPGRRACTAPAPRPPGSSRPRWRRVGSARSPPAGGSRRRRGRRRGGSGRRCSDEIATNSLTPSGPPVPAAQRRRQRRQHEPRERRPRPRRSRLPDPTRSASA